MIKQNEDARRDNLLLEIGKGLALLLKISPVANQNQRNLQSLAIEDAIKKFSN